MGFYHEIDRTFRFQFSHHPMKNEGFFLGIDVFFDVKNMWEIYIMWMNLVDGWFLMDLDEFSDFTVP